MRRWHCVLRRWSRDRLPSYRRAMRTPTALSPVTSGPGPDARRRGTRPGREAARAGPRRAWTGLRRRTPTTRAVRRATAAVLTPPPRRSSCPTDKLRSRLILIRRPRPPRRRRRLRSCRWLRRLSVRPTRTSSQQAAEPGQVAEDGCGAEQAPTDGLFARTVWARAWCIADLGAALGRVTGRRIRAGG
ncbi:MAG: hypothetical protein QOJ80_6530 [Mycobacterium sp.]|nr:hypothetical protein [Mycobacterium sp.]